MGGTLSKKGVGRTKPMSFLPKSYILKINYTIFLPYRRNICSIRDNKKRPLAREVSFVKSMERFLENVCSNIMPKIYLAYTFNTVTLNFSPK